MGGTTPNLALPYPVGTDRVMDGDDAIKALADMLDSRVPWGVSRRRIMGTNHTYSNPTAWTPLNVPGDATPLTANFTKRVATTRLMMRLTVTCNMTSGAAQAIFWGLRRGATDHEIAQFGFPAGPAPRATIAGILEVTGVAAGTYSIQPVLRSAAAATVQLWAIDDLLTWEVEEIV